MTHCGANVDSEVKMERKQSFFQRHCVQEVQIKSTSLLENPMNETVACPWFELSNYIKIYSNGQSHHLAILVFVF